MASFTVNGLSSGIDYGAMIDQLVAIKRIGVDNLNKSKDDSQAKLDVYGTLETKLETLESAADLLRKATTFAVKQADVENTTIFTAAASSTALAGNYIISDITALAQSHKVAADGVADRDTTTALSNGGTFQFTINGTQTTITATSDLTLEGLAAEINSSSGALTATIINDGDATNPYRLVLTSDITGATNAITIDTDDSTLNMDVTLTTLQAAQDASFKLDGLAITKSSNTVTDALEGVSFTLKNAAGNGNSYTLSVSNDTDTIKTNISALIDGYNDVISHIDTNSTYDTEANEGGPLFNEVTTRSIQRRMSTIITTGITGLSGDTKILAQLGVKTNSDGTLTLNETTLNDKLTTDFDDVMALFI
ncbi:MAG: flagellar filament capping protein FliD, partial [Deltaproteobacteria bacterium]|nr:flagellar filament capping protein FliD [Deltaproteobacteria bacterium]